MQHLKSLGVDTSKASVVLVFKDDEGNIYEWDSVEMENDGSFTYTEPYDDVPYWDYSAYHSPEELHMEYLGAETGDYDHSYRGSCGVFTLQDIIALLPKMYYSTIYKEEFELRFKYFETDTHGNPMEKFLFMYENESLDYLCGFAKTDILEAAYELLCWCYNDTELINKYKPKFPPRL